MRRAVREVLAALGRRRRETLRLSAWSMAEALPVTLAGNLAARAIDHGFLTGHPGTGLGWLGVLAAAVLVGAYGSYRVHRCLGAVVEPFRDHLLRLAVTGALQRSTMAGARPDTAAVARLTHQVEIVRDTFAGMITVVRGFLFTTAGATLGLVSLSPMVALLVAPPLAAGLVLFALALPAMITAQRGYVHADERLATGATEVVHGWRDVVACGGEARVAAAVGGQIDAQAATERRLARMAAVRGLCLAVGGWLPLVVLLVATPWLVGRGMTTGAILGALMYVLYGLQPALYTLLRGLGGGGLRLLVTLDRLLRASDPPADSRADPWTGHRPDPRSAAGALVTRGDAAPSPRPRRHPRGRAGLALHAVTFRYGPHAEPVVRDLDLVVAPDAHLAVVGASGVGKSTLAGLMAGTLAPQSGRVRLDGAPVNAFDPVALARLRVLIPQEAYVFTGTLWENLTYLRPDATPATVDDVVDRFGLAPLLERCGGPHGALAVDRLSAGERQLVALARAYLSPARLVLLDEATCHLDPAWEAEVEGQFARRPGALVVVAHRISSALRARQVLVLDGTDVALGEHHDLLRRSARYRDLVGHWQRVPDPPEERSGTAASDPAGVAGDAYRLDPGTGTGLADDPGQVVADRTR